MSSVEILHIILSIYFLSRFGLSHPWDCYEANNYSPPFLKCQDTNGVMGITAKKSNDYIHYFGNNIKSGDECYELSVNYTKTNGNNRTLYSFTYFSSNYKDSSWHNQCYARKTPIWIPGDDGSADSVSSGRIIWPCKNDLDCSLNGKCNIETGKCECRAAWSSFRCDWLNILPGNRSWGLNSLNIMNNSHNNTWGGTVLRDPLTGKYHMFEAEIANHCGLKVWDFMSTVSHSITTATNGIGEYIRKEVMIPPFAHEPDATLSNDGAIVLYYNAQTYPNQPLCNCTNAETHCDTPSNPTFITYMIYSYNISNWSNWSKPEIVIPIKPKDTNFSPVILQNGSLIGFWRTHNSNDPGTVEHLVRASNWKDINTYKLETIDLFPDIPSNDGTEDPFMYVDKNGYFHAIFHNRNPNNIEIYCGGHGYSMDGINWIYGGWAFNNTVQYYNDTTNDIYYVTWTKRERPHFIFDKDGVTPIAITSGLETVNDVTWTGLFPVKT